jgi:uncharacterized protein with PIN domain
MSWTMVEERSPAFVIGEPLLCVGDHFAHTDATAANQR